MEEEAAEEESSTMMKLELTKGKLIISD